MDQAPLKSQLCIYGFIFLFCLFIMIAFIFQTMPSVYCILPGCNEGH